VRPNMFTVITVCLWMGIRLQFSPEHMLPVCGESHQPLRIYAVLLTKRVLVLVLVWQRIPNVCEAVSFLVSSKVCSAASWVPPCPP
jgi:hypothetical protein